MKLPCLNIYYVFSVIKHIINRYFVKNKKIHNNYVLIIYKILNQLYIETCIHFQPQLF